VAALVPVSVKVFRDNFQEFSDPAAYPDEAVQFWLDAAYVDLGGAPLLPSPCVPATQGRFGAHLDLAAELFTAHMLVLGRRNVIESSFSRVPGAAVGLVSSRSVDKVSVSYDFSMISEKGAGFWAMSQYGLRFFWLLRQHCLGPVYRAPCDRALPW
jgi:hypothetical protein